MFLCLKEDWICAAKCWWAPNWWSRTLSPSPLAGVAETELQSCPIGDERSIVENGRTWISKKGIVFQTHHLQCRLPLSLVLFLPPAEERDGERKQNASTWNRERGTIYLRKERKKGGLKKDDDAWSRESNHVIIFERWEKIIFFSFPLSPLLFFILFPQSLCAECIKET